MSGEWKSHPTGDLSKRATSRGSKLGVSLLVCVKNGQLLAMEMTTLDLFKTALLQGMRRKSCNRESKKRRIKP